MDTRKYRVIQRTENDYGYNRRRRSGRKPIQMPLKPLETLINLFEGDDKVSYRAGCWKTRCFALMCTQNNKLEDQNCEKKENAIKVREPQPELSAFDSLAFQQSTLKVKKIKKHSST